MFFIISNQSLKRTFSVKKQWLKECNFELSSRTRCFFIVVAFTFSHLQYTSFFKTTAEPEKIVDIWLNLILTSNCPTVSIVEFELAPFAEFKSDGTRSLILPFLFWTTMTCQDYVICYFYFLFFFPCSIVNTFSTLVILFFILPGIIFFNLSA